MVGDLVRAQLPLEPAPGAAVLLDLVGQGRGHAVGEPAHQVPGLDAEQAGTVVP